MQLRSAPCILAAGLGGWQEGPTRGGSYHLQLFCQGGCGGRKVGKAPWLLAHRGVGVMHDAHLLLSLVQCKQAVLQTHLLLQDWDLWEWLCSEAVSTASPGCSVSASLVSFPVLRT